MGLRHRASRVEGEQNGLVDSLSRFDKNRLAGLSLLAEPFQFDNPLPSYLSLTPGGLTIVEQLEWYGPATNENTCPVALFRPLFSIDPQPANVPLFRLNSESFSCQGVVAAPLAEEIYPRWHKWKTDLSVHSFWKRCTRKHAHGSRYSWWKVNN